MDRPWTDEDRLRELYWEQEMSQYDIADELGCSPRTVRTWMEKHNIETRSTSDAVKVSEPSNSETPWRSKQTLEKLYCEQDMSITQVAAELNCGHNTIHRWLQKHNIDIEDPPQQKPVYYGTDKRGYERWRHGSTKFHCIRVHRLLAVAEYGFDAVSDSVVHHKNNISFDNRADNITLMSRAEHARHHNSKNITAP